MKKKEDSKFVKILQNLTGIITLFTFSSGLWLHFKYKQYGINIFEYVSTYDFIIFEPFVLSLLILLSISPILFLLEIILNENNKIRSFFKKKIVNFYIFLGLCLILSRNSNNEKKYIYIIFIIILIIVFSLFVYNKKIKESNFSLKYSLIFINGLLFLALSFTFMDYINKDNYEGKQLSFCYKDQIIKTSDSLLHIGTTTQAIFLRNINNNSTFVFEKTMVNNLTITTK